MILRALSIHNQLRADVLDVARDHVRLAPASDWIVAGILSNRGSRLHHQAAFDAFDLMVGQVDVVEPLLETLLRDEPIADVPALMAELRHFRWDALRQAIDRIDPTTW